MTDKIQQIRDYADSHDLSEEIEQGHWETDVADDPMITTSLRLPKSLLDWVRAQAAEQHVKPTAWIRELIEQQRSGLPDLEQRVSALEATLASALAAVPEQKTSGRGTSPPKVAAAAKAKAAKTRATRVRVEKGARENIRRVVAAHIQHTKKK